jgi:hypothetical protein
MEISNMSLIDLLKPELENLVRESQTALKEVKRVAVAQAWKILQLAVARTIQVIETTAIGLAGKDKKAVAMELLSKFYDSVFIVVDIPFVPTIVEPIIHRYVKTFLMILVGSTIDAMVTTFRQTGVFTDPNNLDPNQDIVPKVSEK